MPDQPAGTADAPAVADDNKETAIYSAPHLERIRQLYVSGSPISLPAQLEGEREELDAQRATFEKTQGAIASQGSTPTSNVGSLRSNASSTAPASDKIASSGTTSSSSTASPAGTAGSSTSAPK